MLSINTERNGIKEYFHLIQSRIYCKQLTWLLMGPRSYWLKMCIEPLYKFFQTS